ncbi:MAG: glycosyltransferase family 2 protein [Candidatus Geothermarchaeales archaeon]
MKLAVLIPAHNESGTVGEVIRHIPRELPGIESVQVILLNDGSTDDTVLKAEEAGADLTLSSKMQVGLSQTVRGGFRRALDAEADIVVTIDADGQHDPHDLRKLIKPIQEKEADIVLGSRFLNRRPEMDKGRSIGNRMFTKVTNFLSGLNLTDTQTGFRAYSREATLRLNILSSYTYTQETLIQAADKGLRVQEVPITLRSRSGRSKLIESLPSYARRAGMTTLTTYLNYKPLRFFLAIGAIVILVGLITGFRVLIHFVMTGMVQPFLPTAILTAVLIIVGVQIVTLGLFAEMIKSNREITEEIIYELRRRATTG